MNFQRFKRNFVKKWVERDPFCPQCGVEMVLPKGFDYRDNIATYEHEYSRYNPKRGKVKGKNLVICKKCNVENANRDRQVFSKENLEVGLLSL